MQQGTPTAAEYDILSHHPKLTALMSTDWLLRLYQLAMAVGMLMIVVGYVGCFNLVNHSTAANGPYVWLSLEVALSLLRITLWGWNPKWDDTMMHLEITLTNERPLVTTPQDLNEITDNQVFTQSLLVQEQSQFLGSITGFTGPFPPFKAEAVCLYYALVGQADPEDKSLITIIRDLRNGRLIALGHRVTHVFSNLQTYKPLSVTWDRLPGMTDAMHITLGGVLPFVYDSDSNILLHQIHEHSMELARRLAGRRRIWKLDLSWKLTMVDNHFHSNNYPPLSEDDKAYMEI
ncbi:hypothetical protein C8J56DRAFT_801179, partial [Mycena floridula]